MKNKVIFLIMIIFAFSIFSYGAYARSEVHKTGECEFTVYLFMAFTTNNSTLMSSWEQGIENVWNGPNGYQTFGECDCKVKFDVITKNVSSCNGTLGTGWHCFNVTNKTRNRRNNTADAVITRPNTTDSTGEWTERTSPLDAAHEAGHTVGLGEEYEYTNNGTHNIYNVTGNDSMSIMARTWKNSTGHPPHANQWHINQIMSGVSCPDECCCGNNRTDAGKEECDYTTDPTGCEENETCTKECKCVGIATTPRCGDGQIYRPPNYGQPGVGGEECDPNATPTGCDPDEVCMINCVCVKLTGGGGSGSEGTPGSEETDEQICGDGILGDEEECEWNIDDPEERGCDTDEDYCDDNCRCDGYSAGIEIENPKNEDNIDEATDVEVETDTPYDVEYVEFYIDDSIVARDRTEEYTITIDPETLLVGPHNLKAIMYDEVGNVVSDSINFLIGMGGSCGNGLCEEGEYCDTCPGDCTCSGGVCDPDDPLADGLGCVYPE